MCPSVNNESVSILTYMVHIVQYCVDVRKNKVELTRQCGWVLNIKLVKHK